MKIFAVDGSPRVGNTNFLLDFISSNFNDFEILKLRENRINYCGGGDNCCPKTGKCIKNDDMIKAYPKIEAADLIILASPSFFNNVSAQMKTFMDRLNPYYFNKKLENKKFFLISTATREKSNEKTIDCMKEFVKGVFGKVVGNYQLIAEKANDLKTKEDKEELNKIVELIKNV